MPEGTNSLLAPFLGLLQFSDSPIGANGLNMKASIGEGCHLVFATKSC